MTGRKSLVLAVLITGLAYPAAASAQTSYGNFQGTVWSGSETLSGYGSLEFHFGWRKLVVMTDSDGTTAGTWIRIGNQFQLSFYNGTAVYTGTLRRNELSGTASNGRTSWTWSVQFAGTVP